MHDGGDGLEAHLNRHSMEGLQELSELTGASDEENLNRALEVYAFVERQLAAGCSLAFVQPDGSTEVAEIADVG